MQENFLHFLWRWRRFDGHDLKTTDGDSLEIVHAGEPNSDAGPDFFNARLRIADQFWAGNVEIHVKSSDWFLHRHDHDRAYENVILHVVLDDDRPVERASGERIPTLELRNRIPPKIEATWLQFLAEKTTLPCRSRFSEVPSFVQLNWLDRLLTSRLEAKTEAISTALEQSNGHWEQVFFEKLAWNFGLKINAEPFELLAKSLNINILAKHKDHLFQIEALLFGQAGLLTGPFKDDYPQRLAKEFQFLKHKYDLEPLDGSLFKFLRLRPPNFPTVRLAQLAWLIHQSAHLFSKTMATTKARELENLFHAEVSEYWQTHYLFDKPSPPRRKTLGRDAVHLLLANTVAPFLFLYGKTKRDDRLRERATNLLEALPAESNSILDGWAEVGLAAQNAYQSQALLQLSKKFCAEKRCLECAIGLHLLK